jgi:LacI family transcriptional regulator
MLLESESVALLKSSPRRRLPAVSAKVAVRREALNEHADGVAKPQAAAGNGLKHVALLVETTGAYGRGLLQGIAKYNREHGGWSTYFRPHALSDAPPTWLRHWKGDGMIVRIETYEQFEAIRRCGAPAVNLRGTIASELPLPYVTMDNRQVAQLALQHFRDRGIRNFAACGRFGTKKPALGERIEHFRELVEADGGVCHIFPPASARKAVAWEQEQDNSPSGFVRFPSPSASSAATTSARFRCSTPAGRVGVTVPDDVAVLGVDNDPGHLRPDHPAAQQHRPQRRENRL